MPYNYERRGAVPEKKVIMLVIILFLNLILISTQIIMKNRRSFLYYIATKLVSPFQIAVKKSSEFISEGAHRYIFLRGIFTKYKELKKKNLWLQHENSFLRRKLSESHIQEKARDKFQNFFLVKTISIDPNFPFHTIIVDQGSDSGLHENMPVLNLEGDVVGKTVLPVTHKTISVRLITSSVGGIGASLQNTHFEGVLEGNNTRLCLFKYLLENKPVFLGDRVVTSGSDMVFPPDLPIGTVTHVEKDYLVKKIFVRPFFTNHPVRDLVVLKNE